MAAVIFAAYIKRGATPCRVALDKSLHCNAFRASLTLVAVIYIRAADPEQDGDLALRLGACVIEPVPHGDDLRLSGQQRLAHVRGKLAARLPGAQVVEHVVLNADDFHQGEAVPVLIRIDRVRQRQVAGRFFQAPEIHQDFIFDASAGIRGQADPPLRLICGNPFDQPNGADGDEIVLFTYQRVIFLDDMRDQPQIAFDQDVPGFHVPLDVKLDIFLLVCGRQRLRKRPGPVGHPQQQERAHQQEGKRGREHNHTTNNEIGIVYSAVICPYTAGHVPLRPDSYDLYPLLFCVAHRVHRPAEAAVVDGDEEAGMVHHIHVPAHHALGRVFPPDEGLNVGLSHEPEIPAALRLAPPGGLVLTRHGGLQRNVRARVPEPQDGLAKEHVAAQRHPADKVAEAGVVCG